MTRIFIPYFYNRPDPLEPITPSNYRLFCERTSYISTTAGTIERDALQQRNVLTLFAG
jgi:hypothetical protein